MMMTMMMMKMRMKKKMMRSREVDGIQYDNKERRVNMNCYYHIYGCGYCFWEMTINSTNIYRTNMFS